MKVSDHMPWPTKKLGEVCDFQNGLWNGKRPPFKKVKVLRNTNFRNGGYLDLSNVAEIDVEKKQLAERLLQRGDLILERSGGGPTQPVGRVVYFDADDEFSFSNFTTRIRVKNSEELYDRYLWRYLNHLYIFGVTETMQKQTTGIRNLNFSEYKNIEIPLPPLSEQKRIVEKIEKLFAKIDEAERLRAESLAASAALLPSALHQVFSRTEKENWPTKKLGEVCDILDSLRKPVTKRDRKPGPYPYYGATGVQDYVADYIFDEPLVLVGEDGAKWGSGEETAYRVEGKYWVNNHAHVLRPHRNKILDGWLTHFLNISDLSEYITGLTVKKLNQEKLRSIKIPLPPLSEQKKIVAYLDALSAKIRELQAVQQETAADFSALRQSVLARAYS